MKKITVLIAVLLISSSLTAQQKARAYISQLPQLPDKPCGWSKAFIKDYIAKIDAFNEKLQIELEPLRKSAENKYKSSAADVKQNYMKQYGITEADLNKLNDKNASKEEKEKAKNELKNKVLKDKLNMTVEDIEKYKKMSKEGKKAFAENVAAEQAAKAQANPGEFKDQQKQGTELIRLIQERDKLLDKINAENRSFKDRITEFQKYERKEFAALHAKRAPLLKKINDNAGEGGQNSDGLIKQVRSLEENYCGSVSPKHLNIIRERITSLEKQLPDYEQLDKIYSELNQKSMGANKDLSTPDLMSLSAVEDIVGLMRTACDYVTYTFDE